MSKKSKLILAADIGATKTNLGIFPIDPTLPPIKEKTCKTGDFSDTGEMISKFLLECNSPNISGACLGVPGPVMDNQSATTILPWFIDGNRLATDLQITKVKLVNDLEATAAAIPDLQQKDLFTINPGRPRKDGNIAVISPGTGLGEGFLTINSDGVYTPHPSEGGHSDFAPTNQREVDLLRHLLEILGHVSYELVCSGIGLMNLYGFIKKEYGDEEPAWLSDLLNAAPDPSRVIIESALDESRPCMLCQETMSLFVSILGAEAGNLALKTMSTGGVYIGGGITPRISRILDSSLFLKGFFNKGRVSRILSDVPVHVIMNRKAPLSGAALLAREL